jgi:hypothetical protein
MFSRWRRSLALRVTRIERRVGLVAPHLLNEPLRILLVDEGLDRVPERRSSERASSPRA